MLDKKIKESNFYWKL